jgi:hypothetical protein
MTQIVLVPQAEEKLLALARSSPEAFVEIDAKLAVVAAENGLRGEPLIAVVNHKFDVHVLEPPSPGVPVLTISDPAALDEIVVVDFLPFAAALPENLKRALARRAARGFGVLVSDIHVVP